MYLHLGGGVVVRKSQVVGIFDLDNASAEQNTRNYLFRAEKAGAVINAAGDEIPKSFVVCAGDTGEQRIYLCQPNSSTLNKRMNSVSID